MKKLTFCLNKKLDKAMAKSFLNTRAAGIDFGGKIRKIHPQLKTVGIDKYFDNYYQEHKIELLGKIREIEQAWHQHEQKYIEITEKLFGGFPFPSGKYIAYASIIDCNPRFLDTKTFQFFYQKSVGNVIYVITHELLHFIFFDFIEKKMKDEISKLTKEQIWDLSEIFNVVVLKSDLYRSIVDSQNVYPYPDHEKYLRQFEKAYRDSANIDEFIRLVVEIIKK